MPKKSNQYPTRYCLSRLESNERQSYLSNIFYSPDGSCIVHFSGVSQALSFVDRQALDTPIRILAELGITGYQVCVIRETATRLEVQPDIPGVDAMQGLSGHA